MQKKTFATISTLSGGLECDGPAVAFGAKQTCTAATAGSRPALMTRTGHKPGRNPAAQQSPCRTKACYSFWSEAREVLGSETARVHHAARRRGGVAAHGARSRPSAYGGSDC